MMTTLPNWDLSDLYQNLEDPKIQSDIDLVKKKITAFETEHLQRFDQKAKTHLYQIIQDFEEIQEMIGQLMAFSYLSFSTHSNDPKYGQFLQNLQDQLTSLSTPLIPFTLNINNLSDELLSQAYETQKELAHYKSWIDSLRLFKPYQLPEDQEKLLHLLSPTSSAAWVRLFDETLNGMLFDIDGEKVTIAKVLDLMSHKETLKRKAAAHAMSKGLAEKLPLFTLIMNTLVKGKEVEDTWRGYKHPIQSRNLANEVEDEIVDLLSQTVQSNYHKLSHRYYALKAKMMGQEALDYWDRNAPLPLTDTKTYTWDEAKEIVLSAYASFSPEMAKIAQLFFDEKWIDAGPKVGKNSGAYSHPIVPSKHPYILMNFYGKTRDIMTLAHELGHGIHQMLSRDQGYLLSNTPLTIAETASVFGEMLTFQSLLENSNDAGQKRQMLASKIEDMLNTVVRQIAFFEFERQVHMKRRIKELGPDDFVTIWKTTQEKALGPSVRVSEITHNYWAYVSHFFHSPFYVYAYAFGDCLVNSLFRIYQETPQGFCEKYIDLLKAGGSKRYDELLDPFGLNPKQGIFWEKGLSMISDLIDELEALSS